MNLSITAALLLAITGASVANAQTKPAQTAPAPATFAAPLMKPGLWEVSITEQTPPSTNKRTITARSCFSADDVKVIERVLPQQRDFAMKCQNREVKAKGADVSWKVVCTGKEAASSGAATMAIGAESYAAQAKFDVKSKGRASKAEQAITGKWVGDCT
jgi:hypothetical protein